MSDPPRTCLDPLALRLPLPVAHRGHIFSVLGHVELVPLHDLKIMLYRFYDYGFEPGDALNRIKLELIAVHVIEHDHVEWRGGRALFFISADVEVIVVLAPVGQAMDQRRITMIRKDHRAVGGKDLVEVVIHQSMRMLAWRLQRHQVYDVHHADTNIRD